MPSSGDLYTAPAPEVTYELVRAFVLDAEAADLFSESLTFEVKEKRDRNNVAEAVAALANTDGGIVLVGVKDRDATGEARIAGVPKAEHDALASSLHNVIPEAMPEIIPVAIPGGERLVLVLRVDADAVPHPVVVSGKVLYRIPGHSVPADRQRILGLAARDRPDAGGGRIEVPRGQSWEPARLTVSWPARPAGTSSPDSATLRVTGGLTLPRRVLDRPWLDSRARRASLDALNGSPFRISPAWPMLPWEITDARAGRVRLYAESAGTGGYHAESMAYLNLDGRRLSMLLAFRWTEAGALPFPLRPEDFYAALLGALITIASTCRHVAHAIGAAEPSHPHFWEGWLDSSPPVAMTRAVDLARFNRDKASVLLEGHFPPARIPGADIPALDELARAWITYWLLDMGMRDFETWLAALERPDFLRMPGPA